MYKILLVFWRRGELGILLSIFTDLYQLQKRVQSSLVRVSGKRNGVQGQTVFYRLIEMLSNIGIL